LHRQLSSRQTRTSLFGRLVTQCVIMC